MLSDKEKYDNLYTRWHNSWTLGTPRPIPTSVAIAFLFSQCEYRNKIIEQLVELVKNGAGENSPEYTTALVILNELEHK